jgi:hypothetical protein
VTFSISQIHFRFNNPTLSTIKSVLCRYMDTLFETLVSFIHAISCAFLKLLFCFFMHCITLWILLYLIYVHFVRGPCVCTYLCVSGLHGVYIPADRQQSRGPRSCVCTVPGLSSPVIVYSQIIKSAFTNVWSSVLFVHVRVVHIYVVPEATWIHVSCRLGSTCILGPMFVHYYSSHVLNDMQSLTDWT